MTFVSLGISAQLKVYSDGSMTLDRDTSFTGCRFTVGNIPTIVSNIPVASPENIGIYGIATTQASTFNFGVTGAAVSNTVSTGRSFGVCGIAGNYTSGYNYGVFGTLLGTANGAAVYGSTLKPTGSLVPGNLPYETVYIQNQTITGNRTYTSSRINCGTFVDLNQPFGDVVFGGGNIDLINSSIEINGQTVIVGNTTITVSNSN